MISRQLVIACLLQILKSPFGIVPRNARLEEQMVDICADITAVLFAAAKLIVCKSPAPNIYV